MTKDHDNLTAVVGAAVKGVIIYCFLCFVVFFCDSTTSCSVSWTGLLSGDRAIRETASSLAFNLSLSKLKETPDPAIEVVSALHQALTEESDFEVGQQIFFLLVSFFFFFLHFSAFFFSAFWMSIVVSSFSFFSLLFFFFLLTGCSVSDCMRHGPLHLLPRPCAGVAAVPAAGRAAAPHFPERAHHKPAQDLTRSEAQAAGGGQGRPGPLAPQISSHHQTTHWKNQSDERERKPITLLCFFVTNQSTRSLSAFPTSHALLLLLFPPLSPLIITDPTLAQSINCTRFVPFRFFLSILFSFRSFHLFICDFFPTSPQKENDSSKGQSINIKLTSPKGQKRCQKCQSKSGGHSKKTEMTEEKKKTTRNYFIFIFIPNCLKKVPTACPSLPPCRVHVWMGPGGEMRRQGTCLDGAWGKIISFFLSYLLILFHSSTTFITHFILFGQLHNWTLHFSPSISPPLAFSV